MYNCSTLFGQLLHVLTLFATSELWILVPSSNCSISCALNWSYIHFCRKMSRKGLIYTLIGLYCPCSINNTIWDIFSYCWGNFSKSRWRSCIIFSYIFLCTCIIFRCFFYHRKTELEINNINRTYLIYMLLLYMCMTKWEKAQKLYIWRIWFLSYRSNCCLKFMKLMRKVTFYVRTR